MPKQTAKVISERVSEITNLMLLARCQTILSSTR